MSRPPEGIPVDAERFWLLWEICSGLLKWYSRGDLKGLKSSRNALLKVCDGLALSLELRAVDQAQTDLPLDGQSEAP